MMFKVGDRVIVSQRRGADREAVIVEVITRTVFVVRYEGDDAHRAGEFPVGVGNMSEFPRSPPGAT